MIASLQPTEEHKMARKIGERDFNASTIKKLAKKNISIMTITAIPGENSAMPFANSERGYNVNDNGTSRVWTYSQVISASLT